jgi:hypothetical protein
MLLSLTASHYKTVAENLVLRINLTSFDDFPTHNITLLLPLITVNRERGLVIHHTFVDRFCREKNLRQEFQPSFEDGLLTCCDFRCGFFYSHLCHILFDSVMMHAVFSRQHKFYTMKGHIFSQNQFFSPLFLYSKTF